MKIEEKHIKLKDGRDAVLRTPTPDDAETILEFLGRVSIETDFLLRGEGDALMSLDDERKFLERNLTSETGLMISCFVKDGDKLEYAGNCGLNFNTRKKIAHRASIGISVYKKFWGLGIGTALMNEMESIARERGVLQLELEFVEGNSRARALYEKCGFRIAGIHPDAFLMPDGSLKNEYLMMKKL